MRNLNVMQAGLWLALVLALAGSLRHVAWAFATLEGGSMIWGYIQAGAVDVGLFTLAYGIQRRRRQRRSTRTLWVGVALFSGISAYANLLHGLAFASEFGVSRLWQARPLVLSSVLPILVLYLSEVVSSDVQYAVKVEERARKKAERRRRREVSNSEELDGFPYPIEQARGHLTEQQELSKEQALDTMLDIWREQPDINFTDLADRIGRSRTTLYTYLDELVDSGRVVKTEDGVHVVDTNGHRAEQVPAGEAG